MGQAARQKMAFTKKIARIHHADFDIAVELPVLHSIVEEDEFCS